MAGPLDRLSEPNLEFAEDLMRQMYAAEIDRRDKILSSMTVVSAPIAILFAAVAFLANAVSDPASTLASATADIVVDLWIISIVLLVAFMIRALLAYHRLLAAEQYTYLPEATQILAKIAELQDYCETYAAEPGPLHNRLVRHNMIKSYSEAATNNSRSNDRRLQYRQGVFQNTAYALVFAGLTCAAVAWHRQQPHVSDVSTIWSRSDVSANRPSDPFQNSDRGPVPASVVSGPADHH